MSRVITIAPRGHRYLMIGYVGTFQSERNGGAVLKWDKSWRKISGFFINTRWGCVWFRFRRFH